MPFCGHALGPEFFIEQLAWCALPCRLGRSGLARCFAGGAATNDLQAVDLASHIQHGDGHGARWAVAHTVPSNAFAVQVFAITILGAFLPCGAGGHGGAFGVGLACGLGVAQVFGLALADAFPLLCVQLVFGDLHLHGVFAVTAPHTEAANNQVVPVGQAYLMQVIPAALLCRALHLAAA